MVEVSSEQSASVGHRVPAASLCEADLLAAVLEGLYIGRDNKALLVARDGLIVSCNHLAARLCGGVPEAFNGAARVCDFFLEPLRPPATVGSPIERWETDLTTTAGACIPVEVVREPLGTRLPGTLVYAVRDLRERKQAAAERERHLKALEDYTQRLEASNQELQSFATVASHDLQEPLRKIEAFASRLTAREGKDLPPDMAMPLERIQDAARRMRALITALLGYARLDKENKPLEVVSLDGILRGVVSDLQVRIEESGAVVRSEGLPDVEADPMQMRQLMQNLIANALKFSRKGIAPVVVIKAQSVERSGGVSELMLTIADNGIGFDNRHKDQIFKLFKRLHGRSEYEGTGVGLATCRRIVERHGGTIDAEGRPNEGATFIVRLPRRG